MDRNRTFHEVEWDTVLALSVWGVAGGYKQLVSTSIKFKKPVYVPVHCFMPLAWHGNTQSSSPSSEKRKEEFPTPTRCLVFVRGAHLY